MTNLEEIINAYTTLVFIGGFAVGYGSMQIVDFFTSLEEFKAGTKNPQEKHVLLKYGKMYEKIGYCVKNLGREMARQVAIIKYCK